MLLTDAQWARIEPLLRDWTPRRGGRWRKRGDSHCLRHPVCGSCALCTATTRPTTARTSSHPGRVCTTPTRVT
ncbi:hypothetical protein EW053_33300 [Streptomyces sp. IB2014 016-6]|nr:hypothetical protein EW053_33300 [Streptomyces sp. IB2014 016-6]